MQRHVSDVTNVTSRAPSLEMISSLIFKAKILYQANLITRGLQEPIAFYRMKKYQFFAVLWMIQYKALFYIKIGFKLAIYRAKTAIIAIINIILPKNGTNHLYFCKKMHFYGYFQKISNKCACDQNWVSCRPFSIKNPYLWEKSLISY